MKLLELPFKDLTQAGKSHHVHVLTLLERRISMNLFLQDCRPLHFTRVLRHLWLLSPSSSIPLRTKKRRDLNCEHPVKCASRDRDPPFPQQNFASPILWGNYPKQHNQKEKCQNLRAKGLRAYCFCFLLSETHPLLVEKIVQMNGD